MRIDSHVHFLVYQPEEHVWVTDRLSSLKSSFLPTDLEPLLQSMDFEGCVAVEARQMLKENDWLLKLSQTHGIIKGIVGWVDLCSPEVATQLERYAEQTKIKGIRHVVIDEPNDNFMVQDDFQRGIAALKDFDLTYDLLIAPHHIPVAIKLVEKYPDQQFVVNHIALPNIKGKIISPWDRNITELAKFENVFCKLSGMDLMADWRNWRPTDFTPYLDVVFSAFSVDRLMVGSNWPVCMVSGDYQSILDIVLRYIQQFPPEVQQKILGENCARIYKL